MGNDPLEKIYGEAGQWVRQVNAVVWALGSITIPLTLSCIGLALQYPKAKYFLAVASIFIFSFWIYTTLFYRQTVRAARQVLMNIEKEWEVKADNSLYVLQGQVGYRWYGVTNLQLFALVALIIAWIVLLFLSPAEATNLSISIVIPATAI